jgi:hypothetical protein
MYLLPMCKDIYRLEILSLLNSIESSSLIHLEGLLDEVRAERRVLHEFCHLVEYRSGVLKNMGIAPCYHLCLPLNMTSWRCQRRATEVSSILQNIFLDTSSKYIQ